MHLHPERQLTRRARLVFLAIVLSAAGIVVWRAADGRDSSPRRFRVVQRLATPIGARPLNLAELAGSARLRWALDDRRTSWTRVQSGGSTTLRSPRLDLPEDFYGVLITERPRTTPAEATLILWSTEPFLDAAEFARNRRVIVPVANAPNSTLLPSETMLSDERRAIHYLFVHVPDAAKVEDVIEGVAIVTDRDVAAASLSVTRVAADGRTRDAITSSTSVSYRVSVPASAELSFGVRIPGVGTDAPIRVTQRIENRDHVIVDTKVAAGRWIDFRVPIRSASECTFVFSVDRDTAAAPIYWSQPQILAPDASRQPNIVLLVVDALRADKLGAYGARTGLSPVIDRLAAEGAVYKRAYAAASWTKPSVATMLTALYPTTHGLGSRHYADGLASGAATLQGVLAADGYVTVQFSANPFTGAISALDRGFDDALMAPALGHARAFDVKASDLNNSFETWLRGHSRDRFFAYLHAVDTHGAASLAQYDAAITSTDHEIDRLQRLLEDLDLTADTLLVITADHGEAFGEHGRSGHGQSVYEEEIRVPLVVYARGRVSPGVIEDPMMLVDLMPTVLDYAHVPFDRNALQGRSLVAHGNEGVTASPVIATRFIYPDDVDAPGNRTEMHAVVDYPWKLIASDRAGDKPALELYRLDRDAQERDNLAASEPGRTHQLASVLERFLHDQAIERARFGATLNAAPSARTRPSRDLVDQLRSLGYVR
jgi:arylsulfatase A-like enzyme